MKKLFIGISLLMSASLLSAELTKNYLGTYVLASGDTECSQSVSITSNNHGEYSLNPFFPDGRSWKSDFRNGEDYNYRAGNMAPPVMDTYTISENKIKINVVHVDNMAVESSETDLSFDFKKHGKLVIEMNESFKGISNLAYLFGADDGKKLKCSYIKN